MPFNPDSEPIMLIRECGEVADRDVLRRIRLIGEMGESQAALLIGHQVRGLTKCSPAEYSLAIDLLLGKQPSLSIDNGGWLLDCSGRRLWPVIREDERA